MSQLLEIKVPDIGEFKDVPVIEIFVAPGDLVRAEDPVATVESDKATMDIPSPAAGVVRELKVRIGDRVSEGSLILVLDPLPAVPAASEPPKMASVPVADATPAVAPLAAYSGSADLSCETLVLGSGPGGYAAAFRSADLGMKTLIVERYASLGGVCLNVGCIPSKALLHVAQVMEEAAHFGDLGVTFDRPGIDLEKLRAHKAKVVGKLTGGLNGMAKGRKVEVLRGYGSFIDANHLRVELTAGGGQQKTGEEKVVRFDKCIIAAGSAAVRLPFIPDDARIVDSTGALELRQIPGRMLVIGGGIIGLEMATVYSTLGARIEVVEMLDQLMQGPDRDLVKVWERQNAHRFDRIMLKTKTVAVDAQPDGLWVRFEGENAPAEPQRYDMILQSAGRSPNGRKIGAENAGVTIGERGFILVDAQMRTNVAHIFAIGDIARQPMLAHKATHEGHVAAEAAAGLKSYFDASVIPGVSYTDPEVAWVGLTETEAKQGGRAIRVARFPWAASGRAIANGAEYGMTKLVFDEESHRVVGGGVVGPGAGDLIAEITLAIEMGCDAADIGKTIHPHPTLGETVGMAAEVEEGVCTDLPAARRRQ